MAEEVREKRKYFYTFSTNESVTQAQNREVSDTDDDLCLLQWPYLIMDIFLKKMVKDKTIVVVVFLSGVVTACHLTPDISITSLTLEGLSGSCLQIPCNFTIKEIKNFPGHKHAVAVWIKTQSQYENENSNFVIFNGSRETGKNYPMEITGDLSQKNCTTVFNDLKTEYTEKYFFRVEDEDFKSTASCDPIDIKVQESPWSPTINISSEQNEEVTITCSAVTPCPGSPPQLTWDPQQQDTPNDIEENSDGTFTTKIKLKGTLTGSHKRYNLTCSAAYPVNGGRSKIAQTTITLSATYTFSGKAGSLVKWVPALCAVIVIALICVIVYIWRFKLRHPTSLPAQVQAIEEHVVQEPAQTEDSLHYGDVSFNMMKPKPISMQEETVYSQVNMSQPNNSGIRQATEMADIYSQVKK